MADNKQPPPAMTRRLATILANVGVETGIDPKVAPGFSQLSNVQISRQGAFSQRVKFKALPIQPAGGYRGILATMSGAPALFSDVGVYMYGGSNGTDGGFVNVDEGVSDGRAFIWVSCELINLGLDEANCARNGWIVFFDNYVIVTYLAEYVSMGAGDFSNLYLNIYSKYSYELIYSAKLASYPVSSSNYTPNAPIVLVEDVAMVFYGEADGDVVCREISIVADYISVGSAVSIGSSRTIPSERAVDYAPLDACVVMSTYVGVTFISEVDSNTYDPCLRIFNRVSAGSYASMADVSFSINGQCEGVSCFTIDDYYFSVVVYDSLVPMVSVATYDYLGSETRSAETVFTDSVGFRSAGGFEVVSGSSVIVAQKVNVSDTKLSELWRRNYDWSSGPSGTASMFMGGVSLMGKPFAYKDRAFCPVLFMDEWDWNTNQTSQSLQQWIGIVSGGDITNAADLLALGRKPFAMAGVQDASISPFYPSKWWTPQSVYQNGEDVYFVFMKKFASDNREQAVVICHAAFNAHPSLIDTHGSLIASASVPMAYDGRNFVELGFLQYPFITLTESTATSYLEEGTYAYAATYEWIDGDGNLHQSAPNVPVTITTSAPNKRVTVKFSTLQCTWKTGVKVVIWRSKKDNTLTLYRLTTVDNDFSVTVDTYADGNSDATTDGAAPLYMSPSDASNIMSPQHNIACMYQNRHVCADADHPGRVRYSKPIGHRTLSDGIEHNDSMYFDVPGESDITGVSALDDKLIIFTADKIYATYGEGYAPSGAGTNYVQPFLLSGHTGCVNHRTLVAIDQGLLFDSGTTIMLLGRDLQLTDVGEKVRYYYDNMTINQGIVDKKRNQVLFFGTPTNAITLVFNYKYGIWSTHAYGAKSACYSSDLLYIEDSVSDSQYSVKVEDTAYSNIAMDIVSNWINLGELGGAHRLHNLIVLGQHAATAVTVRVSLAFNYEPWWRQTRNYDLSTLTAFDADEHYGAGSSTYQDDAMILKLQPAVQKCTSFRVRITEYGTPGATPSFDVTSIMVEISDDDGFYPVGTARRGGL